MVYVDPRNLGYEPYWHKWMLKFTKNKERFAEFINTMDEIYPRYIPILMKRIFEGYDNETGETYKSLEFTLPRTNLNLQIQLTRILDALLNIESLPDPDKLESIFIYATVWSLGACLSIDSKKIFEEKLRSLVQKPMPDKKISIFDFYFDMKREWVNWKDEVRPY
jgi:dynein heavy chain